MKKRERIAVIDGIRTPFGKTGGALKESGAVELGVHVVKALLKRVPLDAQNIDEVILGNAAQPSTAMNIARVIALKSGLDQSIPAYTVHRNCASGMESVTSAITRIDYGDIDIALVGGVESMSNIPLLYNSKSVTLLYQLMNRKTPFFKKLTDYIRLLAPSYLLNPRIGLVEGLTDPVSGLIMGKTAENLAKDFSITREEQDLYALNSHKKAAVATDKGILKEEIVPFINSKGLELSHDEGIRPKMTLDDLSKLKPYFEPKTGSVTIGNSCPTNDGASALIIMTESKARSLGIKPLGYIKEFSYMGVDPSRMGIGPVFAMNKLLNRTGLSMKDIELFEINEAFAAQVIACLKAVESDSFAKTNLGRDKALGAIDPSLLNVNGGSIALGHPVGVSGTRIILTALKELNRREKNTAIATLCVGGGQGGAVLLERE